MVAVRRQGWITGVGLMGAVVFGFAIRRWPWGRLGLDQFDEGIYCLVAAHWARMGSIDPGLIPYAPPGYPGLVAFGAWIAGGVPPGNLVSALAGSLTILIAGLVARSLFGNVAALATAWSFTLAGPHIAFSRMALTDATFSLAWMIGVGASVAFVRRPGWASGLLMGCSVGLAQEVKYNGWLLAFAVLLSSILGLYRAEDRQPARWLRLFGCGLIGAGGASLLVFPWYRFVAGHGGYADLLRHQRSYLDPPSFWLANLRSQATQAVALATPWPLVGIGQVALTIVLLKLSPAPRGPRWQSSLRLLFANMVVGVLLVYPVSVGLVLLPAMVRDTDPARRFIAIVWLLLGILTPFYHPYARLWLPFEGMHWLLLGGWLAKMEMGLFSPDKTKQSAGRLVHWVSGGGITLAIGLALWLPHTGSSGRNHPTLFQPSNRLEELARTVDQRLPRPTPELLVLARPALTYSLTERLSVTAQESLDQIRTKGDRSAWVLIDSTLLMARPMDSLNSSALLHLENWVIAEEFDLPLTLPTALDLDPCGDLVGRPVNSRFWLLRPLPRKP